MNNSLNDPKTRASAMDWLRSDITVTLPGWVFASAAGVALVLLLVALD